MTDEELKENYTLFSNLWKLVRQNHDCKTDQDWDRLRSQAKKIVEQYGHEVDQLVIDTLELIERRCKNNGRKKHNEQA